MILDRGYVHGGDVYSQPVRLDFSANVNPCGAPEAVKAAVREAASKLADYPDPYCGPLREKLAALNGVDRDNVICGNGAATASPMREPPSASRCSFRQRTTRKPPIAWAGSPARRGRQSV